MLGVRFRLWLRACVSPTTYRFACACRCKSNVTEKAKIARIEPFHLAPVLILDLDMRNAFWMCARVFRVEYPPLLSDRQCDELLYSESDFVAKRFKRNPADTKKAHNLYHDKLRDRETAIDGFLGCAMRIVRAMEGTRFGHAKFSYLPGQ